MNWRGHAVLHALSAACRSAWLDDQQSKKEELCGDQQGFVENLLVQWLIKAIQIELKDQLYIF